MVKCFLEIFIILEKFANSFETTLWLCQMILFFSMFIFYGSWESNFNFEADIDWTLYGCHENVDFANYRISLSRSLSINKPISWIVISLSIMSHRRTVSLMGLKFIISSICCKIYGKYFSFIIYLIDLWFDWEASNDNSTWIEIIFI